MKSNTMTTLDWTKQLPEIGSSLEYDAMRVDRLIANAAQAVKDAEIAIREFRESILENWTEKEIRKAKKDASIKLS